MGIGSLQAGGLCSVGILVYVEQSGMAFYDWDCRARNARQRLPRTTNI